MYEGVQYAGLRYGELNLRWREPGCSVPSSEVKKSPLFTELRDLSSENRCFKFSQPKFRQYEPRITYQNGGRRKSKLADCSNSYIQLRVIIEIFKDTHEIKHSRGMMLSAVFVVIDCPRVAGFPAFSVDSLFIIYDVRRDKKTDSPVLR